MRSHPLKSKKLLLLLTTFLISGFSLKAAPDEEKETFSIQKFKTDFDNIVTRNSAMLNSAAGKDIVVLLGKTGAGKSTTINFLANKELKTNEEEELELVNPSDPTSMKIGSGGTSQTSIPQHTVIDNLVYYDIPGFQDTRGSNTELANASIIKHLIESAKTSRLLFVIGQDEVTASRGASFKELIQSSGELFPENKKALKSSLIIITKSLKKNLTSSDLMTYMSTRIDEDLIDTWTKSRNIFPISKIPQPDQREAILSKVKALSPERIYHVDVSRIYNSNLRMELQGIFLKEFKEILLKALEKGKGDTSTIQAIEILQHYFAKPFVDNNMTDKENSQLFKYLKPLSINTYKKQEDTHSTDVKTNQSTNQDILRLKKESLEREELRKREEENRKAAEAKAAEAERQRVIEQQKAAEAERQRVIEQQRAAEAERQRVAEQQRAAEAERQRAAEQQKSIDQQQKLIEQMVQQQQSAAAEQQKIIKQMQDQQAVDEQRRRKEADEYWSKHWTQMNQQTAPKVVEVVKPTQQQQEELSKAKEETQRLNKLLLEERSKKITPKPRAKAKPREETLAQFKKRLLDQKQNQRQEKRG